VTSACPAIVVATVKRWFHPTEHDDDRWRGGRYNEAELLNLLPFALAKKMRDHMYRQLVLNVPLFRGLQDQAMDRLVNLLHHRGWASAAAARGDHSGHAGLRQLLW
jgi:hypothetical protein